MNSDLFPNDANLPVYGEDADICFTIEVIAELAGVDPETVLHYQEMGFIRPTDTEKENTPLFDAECLR